MVEALSSSETPVLTRATWRNIPVDAILHSHLRENLKSYIRHLVSVEATGSCLPTGNIEVLRWAVFKSLGHVWSDAHITEVLNSMYVCR
jgi:hypothetical protein